MPHCYWLHVFIVVDVLAGESDFTCWFLGGHVLVKCVQGSSQDDNEILLQMDYITDIVISNRTVAGTPYVSPDSKNVVLLDEKTGQIKVFTVKEDGTFYMTILESNRSIMVGLKIRWRDDHQFGITSLFTQIMDSFSSSPLNSAFEPRHVISNNVAF